MKMQWNKVTWHSLLAAIVLGVGIFALGIYIGMVYQQGRDAMELAEGLRMKYPPIVDRTTETIETAPLFMQEGNIKNMASGYSEEDDWILVYEQPGKPALTVGIIFTTQSRCIVEKGIPLFCNTANFEQGERVVVMGVPDAEGKIVVERLEAVR